MVDPLFRLNLPAPLASTPPLAVFGLITKAAMLPVAVKFALTLTLLVAVSVNAVFALQVTASLRFKLPVPATCPLLLCKMTLFALRLDESVAPEMSPPEADTVKSFGSISHVPTRPLLAAVLILVVSATLTCAALVSIKPPFPPLGALASIVPPTFTLPPANPPNKVIFPSWLTRVWASIVPELFTMLANSVSFAPALNRTIPPSALIKPPFSARLFKTLCSTTILTRLLPFKFKVTALAPPKTTMPIFALIEPWLLTWLPSSAT